MRHGFHTGSTGFHAQRRNEDSYHAVLIEEQRRECTREVLRTTPGLGDELIILDITGKPDYENGQMGLPADEELEDMRRWSRPVKNPDQKP